MDNDWIPSGERSHFAMERSTMLLMGKSTISMAIFHCYVSSPEGTHSDMTRIRQNPTDSDEVEDGTPGE